MSLENIVVVLEKLEKMHRSLLETANKKTELIKQNDMNQLDALLKNEQAHIAAIETLEKQRQDTVMDYFQNKGITDASEISISKLLEVAEEGILKERLQEIRKNLFEVIENLKVQNNLNQKLVFNSLQVINITLQAMQPNASNQQFNYSGEEVRGQSSVTKKSYYDSKA